MRPILTFLVLPILIHAAPALADCPPAPDIAADEDRLFDRVQAAPDARTAQEISTGLWELWTTAPDARAQSLLDEGMLARQSYDYDRAAAALDDLVAYCPDYAEGWNQRAFVRFLRSDHGAAIEDLDRALALNPRHVGALSGKGLALMALGRRQAAEGVIREAVRLNPWLPERRMLPEPKGQDI